ncbi:MAG: LLM class flavin-dependent oxidoreductase [Mycetocola sp.]
MTIPTPATPGADRVLPGEQLGGSRPRIGFITHLDQHDDPRSIYADNIELIQQLEQLGFDSAWTATRHFHSGWAALPTPYAFYGAVAAQTSVIGLGTAVLPIQVDDPIRAAEEVAVLDHLSGGRLLLGVGKGVPSDGYHVFGRWGADRDNDFATKTEQLHWGISASQVPDSGESLFPPAPDLHGRILHGSSNAVTIAHAAELGDGFLLERFGSGDERTPENQAAWRERQAASVRAYLRRFREVWGSTRTPYVAASRSAWPGSTTQRALAEVGEAVDRWVHHGGRHGRFDLSLDRQGQLESDSVLWGDPSTLVDRLLEDPTIPLTDEIVLGIHPAHVSIEETVARARLLITEVVPELNERWAAARAVALADLDLDGVNADEQRTPASVTA